MVDVRPCRTCGLLCGSDYCLYCQLESRGIRYMRLDFSHLLTRQGSMYRSEATKVFAGIKDAVSIRVPHTWRSVEGVRPWS